MPNDSAHNSYWQTSDAIFAGMLSIGLYIHFLKCPLHIVNSIAMYRIIIGIGTIITGCTLIAFAKLAFKKSSQPSAPKKPTTAIVQTGIFRFSRNPTYAGLVLIFSGIGLTSNILWLIILTLPLALLFQHVLIIPEEKYLLDKFGETYAEYMSQVRRWL